jgi:hypothetical protein
LLSAAAFSPLPQAGSVDHADQSTAAEEQRRRDTRKQQPKEKQRGAGESESNGEWDGVDQEMKIKIRKCVYRVFRPVPGAWLSAKKADMLAKAGWRADFAGGGHD